MIILGLNIPVESYLFWWVLILIISLIIYLFVIYRNEEWREATNNFLKKYWLWILFVLSYLFFMNHLGMWNYMGFWQHRENVIWLFFASCIIIYKLYKSHERYKSTHAICDNRSGSCARYKIGSEYVALSIGSTDHDFNFKKGHETWLVPKRHFHKINNNLGSTKTQIRVDTNVQRCELIEVPAEFYEFLLDNNEGYNVEEIYYGELSLEEINRKEKIKGDDGEKYSPGMFFLKIKDANRMTNETRINLKEHSKMSKRFLSDIGTMKKKSQGEGGFKVVDNNGTEQ